MKKMISMTAAELAKVAERIHHDERTYAPDTTRHDRYGCDTDDRGHMFDHDHVEDVFPY